MGRNGSSRRGWLAGVLTGLASWLSGHAASAGRGLDHPSPANGTCSRCGGRFEPAYCGPVTTYCYDGVDRLLSVVCPGGSVATYHYHTADPRG